MATTYRVFELAERVETVAAELYRVLAVRFERQPAGDVFLRLSAEEVQHATRVRLVAAQYRGDPRLFSGARGLEEGAKEAEALVASAERTLRDVEAGAWGTDLGAVLDEVIAFEGRTAALHAHLLAEGAHPKVRSFLEQLAQQDRAHHRLLGELRARAA